MYYHQQIKLRPNEKESGRMLEGAATGPQKSKVGWIQLRPPSFENKRAPHRRTLLSKVKGKHRLSEWVFVVAGFNIIHLLPGLNE